MAKRRKLLAPSAEDLSRIAEEVDREVSRGPMSAPIAQVAAEAASAHDVRSAAEREAAARDKSDADRLRRAEADGLVMVELPLDQIRRDAVQRDRVVIDREELDELKHSITKGGLRLPIEVFALEGEVQPYGLLSGYRRLMAMQELCDLWKGERFATIKAVIREPADMAGTFAAMVEENEIRSALSHFERGRIAVLAAQQGAFASTEEAVNALFSQASKAKRSKIRSFALIFEELGDMLEWPDQIKEKDGLRLAAALRDGAEAQLREALEKARIDDADQEAAVLANALSGMERRKDPKKGGRPKRESPATGPVQLQAEEGAEGWTIHVTGQGVDRARIDRALIALQKLLEG